MLSAPHTLSPTHGNSVPARLSDSSDEEWKLRDVQSLSQERGAGKQERQGLDPGLPELVAGVLLWTHLHR